PLPVGPNSKLTTNMISRNWSVVPDEALTKPAIRELAGFNLWMKYFLNSSGMTDFMELPDTQGVILRMNVEIKMTGPTDLPAFDPELPVFQEKLEVTDISSDAVADSVFEVPEGFVAAPIEELIKGGIESRMQPPTPPRSEFARKSEVASIEAYVPHRSPIYQT